MFKGGKLSSPFESRLLYYTELEKIKVSWDEGVISLLSKNAVRASPYGPDDGLLDKRLHGQGAHPITRQSCII